MADAIYVDILTGKNELQKSLEGAADYAKGMVGPLLKVAGAAAAAATAIAGVITAKSIESASAYEDVVNQLNMALAASGRFSKEASDSFRDYASSLQETTKFSDDQVLSSAALIQNLARLSNEGLKEATKAALDLSSAMRIDLDTASQMIGKAANGNVASLNKFGIEVKKGTTDVETFANALRELEKRFGGASEAAANTFSGSIAKLKNSFDDVFKEIGRAFTKSPALIAAVNEVSKIFFGMSEGIKKSLGQTDIFKDIIINFSVVMQAGVETAKNIGLSFELAYQRALAAWYAFKVGTTLGLSDTFNQQLMDINTKIDETKARFSQENPITMFFDQLIMKVSATNGKLMEFTTGIQNMPGQVEGPLSEMQLMIDSLAKSVRQRLATGFSQGIQAVVVAMKQGKNAFSAFGSQIFSMFGDIAIQIGETMILTGIGMEAVRDSIIGLTGGPAIMAGIALIAFGALLKSLSGGGGKSSGGGGSKGSASAGGGSMDDSFDSGDDVTELERQKPSTQIKVEVQGNVFDRRETGLAIAEVLQETIGTNGIQYT